MSALPQPQHEPEVGEQQRVWLPPPSNDSLPVNRDKEQVKGMTRIDTENMRGVAAGGAALGAIVALAFSTAIISPLLGAFIGASAGALGGRELGAVRNWIRNHYEV